MCSTFAVSSQNVCQLYTTTVVVVRLSFDLSRGTGFFWCTLVYIPRSPVRPSSTPPLRDSPSLSLVSCNQCRANYIVPLYTACLPAAQLLEGAFASGFVSGWKTDTLYAAPLSLLYPAACTMIYIYYISYKTGSPMAFMSTCFA